MTRENISLKGTFYILGCKNWPLSLHFFSSDNILILLELKV